LRNQESVGVFFVEAVTGVVFPQHFFHEQETILTHFSNFIQTKGSRFL